LFVIFLELLS
jgi:hypothetical protein